MLFSSSCQHFVWGTETGEHEDRPPVRIRSAKPKPKVFKEFLSQAGMDLRVLEALLENNAVLSRHCEGNNAEPLFNFVRIPIYFSCGIDVALSNVWSQQVAK